MMLPPGIVKIRAEELIMSGEFNKTTPLVMRMYITTAHSLKEKAQGDKRINKDLLTILLKLPTPRFVWCVDLSTREEFASQSISGRIIFDITAGTYERTPWLLYHDNLRVKYFDSEQQKYFEEPLNIEPYSIYKNNLHEVSPL
jgi:hypothetical protein